MPDCRVKLVSCAIFWFIVFAVSLSLYILPLPAAVKARCTILKAYGAEELPARSKEDEKVCVSKFRVTVKPEDDSKEFKGEVNATTPLYDCNRPDVAEVEQDLAEGKTVYCWYLENKSRVEIPISGETDFGFVVLVLGMLSVFSLVLTIFFFVFFLLVLLRIFRAELIRCCPRFILTTLMNIQSYLLRRRASSREQTQPNRAPEDIISRPPMAASRRRIATLIDKSRLSSQEVEALHAEGWSCCICLEERDEDERIPAVSRLRCNHATHSECLRAWLEKGRAVCCLCNADVFSDTAKSTNSSRRTSASGLEAGPVGSLIVEQTEHAPSSPSTSVFIEVYQNQSDTPTSADERDADSR